MDLNSGPTCRLGQVAAKLADFDEEELFHAGLAEPKVSQIPEQESPELFPVAAVRENDSRNASVDGPGHELVTSPHVLSCGNTKERKLDQILTLSKRSNLSILYGKKFNVTLESQSDFQHNKNLCN